MPLTQDTAFELLESAKERGRLGHAFLITGAEGVGKRELASRIINLLNLKEESGGDLFGDAPVVNEVKSLEALHSEFIRIVKPRSKSRLIRVEDMRDLETSFQMSAPPGQWKVGVIIDADRMNEAAANAFLNTLEEPPKDCLLLLITSAPDRLLVTILSRCISIPLYSADTLVLSPLQQELNAMITDSLKSQSRGLATALSLKTNFDLYLKGVKDGLTKKFKASLKAETEHLKQVAEKDFLKDKEEQAKAEEASEYLSVRTNAVNALVAWFGDVIRWKVGHTPSLYKRSTEIFGVFADDLTIDDLLKRMEALEDLRYLLTETNVSEALALETSFMTAFG